MTLSSQSHLPEQVVQLVACTHSFNHRIGIHWKPQRAAWSTEVEGRTQARSTNPNSCSTRPALWEIYRKSTVLQGKRPRHTAEKVAGGQVVPVLSQGYGSPPSNSKQSYDSWFLGASGTFRQLRPFHADKFRFFRQSEVLSRNGRRNAAGNKIVIVHNPKTLPYYKHYGVVI